MELPLNLNKPIICVAHRQLKRASEDSPYRSECLKCRDGIMLVRRNQVTLELESDDNCISCGQRYRYIDINDLKEMWG